MKQLTRWIMLVIATGALSGVAGAADNPLALFAGEWDVTLTTTHPERTVLTYRERYEMVLGGHFVQGATFDKSDGNEDLIIGTYDEQGQGYSFWIFSSSGGVIYLPPGEWNERKRRFRWKSPPNSDVYFTTELVFPDDETRRWTVKIKDWKGSTILEQRGDAVRRRD